MHIMAISGSFNNKMLRRIKLTTPTIARSPYVRHSLLLYSSNYWFCLFKCFLLLKDIMSGLQLNYLGYIKSQTKGNNCTSWLISKIIILRRQCKNAEIVVDVRPQQNTTIYQYSHINYKIKHISAERCSSHARCFGTKKREREYATSQNETKQLFPPTIRRVLNTTIDFLSR